VTEERSRREGGGDGERVGTCGTSSETMVEEEELDIVEELRELNSCEELGRVGLGGGAGEGSEILMSESDFMVNLLRL
jgi:hypothetical protein